MLKEYQNVRGLPAEEDDTLIQNEITMMMLRSMGEEFSRPLGLIANNCEYLQMHLTGSKEEYSLEKAMVSLADINSATLHLNRLFENFMEMTANMQGTLRPSMQLVDLVSVLKDICVDSADIYQAIGITLQLEFGELSKALVVADRSFTERICLHLLSNALHACTEGEHVVFSLEEGEGGFVLRITDDGYGFPPERVLRAFEPFQGSLIQKAPGFERGTGLGLYLCGEYCRLMGWKISIALKEPGTQISIVIPANEQIHAQKVCFHSSVYESAMQAQLTRMQVLRELRTVPGLETLRR